MTSAESDGEPGTASRHETFMRAALEVAHRGMLAGEPPVGACLVAGNDVVTALSNAVIGELDITAHAEMRVIREACRELRRLDLSGCTLYVTVEPCQMCLAACHYAGIDQVIFGAPIEAMHAVTANEISSDRDVLHDHSSPLRLEGGCLAVECRALIETWSGARQTGTID